MMRNVELEDIELVHRFPRSAHAFAYGSGVFRQPGLYRRHEKPMIDLIFVVDDPITWHQQVKTTSHGDLPVLSLCPFS